MFMIDGSVKQFTNNLCLTCFWAFVISVCAVYVAVTPPRPWNARLRSATTEMIGTTLYGTWQHDTQIMAVKGRTAVNLILWRPLLHKGTAVSVKHTVPDRVKPSLVIFDIRALTVSGWQKLQMKAKPSLAQYALQLYTASLTGDQNILLLQQHTIHDFLLMHATMAVNYVLKSAPCTGV